MTSGNYIQMQYEEPFTLYWVKTDFKELYYPE
jgi:hypothetical protein